MPNLQTAVNLHRAGRMGEAIALYRQLAQANAQDATAPRLLALALANRGHVQDALFWIDKALTRDCTALETRLAKAHILVQAGQQPAAQTVLEGMLENSPDCESAHQLMVDLARKQAAPAFLDAVRNAVKYLPRRSWPHQQLGRFLASSGQFAPAVEPLSQAAILRSDDADAHYDLGVALQETGQTEAAITAYRKALALKPGLVHVHHNLASALQSVGNMAAALPTYAQALLLDPASFPRIAQDLAAGASGMVFLRAEGLRARLQVHGKAER